jgi:[calcium/calmodulin-dependent protein kinase] kinase
MLNQFASTALDKVKREIEIMQDLIHPNVLQLREVLLDEHDDKLYMVLDLCEGGELMSWDTKKLVYSSDVFSPMACQAVCSVDATATRPAASLGGLPLNFVKYLIYQAIDALEYVHSCGVVHRDIKPENCFLHADGSLRLGDFGVAFQFDNDDDRMMSDSNGTYAFMAPEQCGGMEYDAFMADVWALGVTAYALVYGRLPHFSDNTATMFESIQSGIIVFPDVEPRAEAEQAKAFLLQILARNPMDRAGLLQLKVTRTCILLFQILLY